MRDMQETRFNPWVGKMRWSRKWQPTPIFFPGEFHGQRSLAGAKSWTWLSDWAATVTLTFGSYLFRLMLSILGFMGIKGVFSSSVNSPKECVKYRLCVHFYGKHICCFLWFSKRSVTPPSLLLSLTSSHPGAKIILRIIGLDYYKGVVVFE